MVKNPLILKEYAYPIESTRKLLMEETSHNIKGSKKFSFKKYLTEKERLKQYFEQRKQFNDIYDDKGKLIKKQIPEKKKKRTRTVIYQQPRMRFKPRTELERIVDSINDYNYGKLNNDLIQKQFRNMEKALMKQRILKERKGELSDSKTDSDSSYDNYNDNNVNIKNKHETTSEKTSLSQSKQSFYKGKTPKRILVDNSVAKKLMEEYHYKTHFKAAAHLADKYTDDATKQKREEMFKNKSRGLNMNNKTFNRSHSCIKFRNKTFYKDVSNKDISKQMNDSVLSQFASKFPLREENFDLVQANPLLYNLNFHSFKSNSDLSNQHNNSGYSMEEKLNYLKNLSFNYSIVEEENVTKKKVTFAESIDKKKEKAAKKLHSLISSEDDDMHIDFNKDDKIWVNDEAISLGQMDLIALKILRNCNYFHKKNANNNTSLKKGDGKLMITSGMTVNEFTKKYKLNLNE